MDYYHGYRHFDIKAIEPLFPFGFGLSYTRFSYANLRLPCASASHSAMVDVQVDVTNVGERRGSDVLMLFASVPESTAPRRALKELKAFQRVELDPAETQTVTLQLRVRDLAYYDMGEQRWADADDADRKHKRPLPFTYRIFGDLRTYPPPAAPRAAAGA